MESSIAPLVMDAFDLSNDPASKDYKLALTAQSPAVLYTRRDEPDGWLAAGQALARVLLRAAADGVSATFFNQPVEVNKMCGWLAATMRVAAFP